MIWREMGHRPAKEPLGSVVSEEDGLGKGEEDFFEMYLFISPPSTEVVSL